MRFLLTIYADESLLESATEEELRTAVNAYWALDAEAREQGALVESAGLHPSTEARTLRLRDGGPQLADGPFAETKEQLGGFYLLECRDLDEALEWAAKIPGAQSGSVEVRQVMDYEAAGLPDPAGEAARSA